MFKESTGSQEKESKKNKKERTNNKMADLSPNVAIITLNGNGLHTSIKR